MSGQTLTISRETADCGKLERARVRDPTAQASNPYYTVPEGTPFTSLSPCFPTGKMTEVPTSLGYCGESLRLGL